MEMRKTAWLQYQSAQLLPVSKRGCRRQVVKIQLVTTEAETRQELYQIDLVRLIRLLVSIRTDWLKAATLEWTRVCRRDWAVLKGLPPPGLPNLQALERQKRM